MRPQRGVVLPGAKRFGTHNANDVWLGTVRLNDGSIVHAVLKDVYDKELANELLGAALASNLELPVPQTILAVADHEVVPATRGRAMSSNHRLLFGSERKGTPPLNQIWTGEHMPQAIRTALGDWKQCGDTFSFDSWTANTDRNRGNLLFGSSGDVWLIDHGEAFTGRLWSADDLQPSGSYQNKMASWLIPHLTAKQTDALRSAAWAMQQAVRKLDLDAIAKASLAASILTVRDTAALLAFLKERINHFPAIAMTQAGSPELPT